MNSEVEEEHQVQQATNIESITGPTPSEKFFTMTQDILMNHFSVVPWAKYTISWNKDTRVRSYVNWPHNTKRITTDWMAKAGFQHLKYSDYVYCSSCALQYKHWKARDDPWQIHKRLEPNCAYVNLLTPEEWNNTPETKTMEQHESCTICYEYKRTILFLPCKHMSACFNCSITRTHCHLCRGMITAITKVYMS